MLKNVRTYSKKLSLLIAILFSISFINFTATTAKPADATFAQTDSVEKVLHIRPEHIALNLAANVEIAKWYQDNFGMKLIRQGGAPNYTTFITDSSLHMMFELFVNKDYPFIDLPNIHFMSLHFAFMVNDLTLTKDKLLKAGCKVAEELKTTASGDKVMMLRDPWDLPIQFVQRVKPMLSFSDLRLEHIAINIDDPVAVSKWYVENLGMKIIKQGGAPSFGTFMGDVNDNITFELYHNKDYPFPDLNKINHMTIHLAFMVDNIEGLKTKLASAGAKVVEDITTSASGDKLLMMRDPWGLPIQFVMRKEPMLK